jgi:hypothetical protein
MKKAGFASMMALAMLVLVALILPGNPAPTIQAQILVSPNIELVNYLGGRITAVYIAGNYAYLGQGNRIAIVNVSNPAVPVVVGQTDPLPGSASAIYATHGYVYAYINEYLFIVDANDPVHPIVVNYIRKGYDKIVIRGSQNRIYILGAYHWDHPYYSVVVLEVFDITNPASPQLIGNNYNLGNQTVYASGLVVVNNLVYMATGPLGLHIANASNPQQVTETGSYDTYAQDVFVSGTVAYVGMGSMPPGLTLLNISVPTSPTLLSNITGTVYHVSVAGNIAYVAGNDSRLRFIDVSHAHTPVEIGAYDAGATINDITIVNGRAYLLLATGELLILNVNSVPAVTELGRYAPWPLSVSSIAISGSLAYLIDSGKLQVMDLHDPQHPTKVGTYDHLRALGLLKVSDQVAYVVDSAKVLNLLDISNPITPVVMGVYTSSAQSSIKNFAIESTTVYLAEGTSGLSILDVSNPVTPTQVSTYSIDARDVAVANGLAYVLAGNGVHIIDVRNPITPSWVVSYPITTDDLWTWVGAVRVSDNKAVVTTHHIYWCGYSGPCFSSTMTVLDISDPSDPVPIGSYTSEQASISDFLVRGGLIYMANDALGLKVLNASDPMHITEEGSFPTGGTALTAVVMDHLIYVVDSSGGLYGLRPKPEPLGGQVTDHYLSPVAGVAIEAGEGVTATTDVSGQYLFTGLTWGTHVLTPALEGYVFIPPTRTVTIPPMPESQDFVILPAPVSTTLTPGDIGSSLSYTDTQGLLTHLDFPANAVSTTLTLVLTPTFVSDVHDWAFAGHAFDLAAYQAGVLQSAVTFSGSVTVTIQYGPRDVFVVSDTTHLELLQWVDENWQSAQQSCSSLAELRSPNNRQSNTFSGALCNTGQFALFGPAHQAYLPIVLRNAY